MIYCANWGISMNIECIRGEVLNYIQQNYDIVITQAQCDAIFFSKELKLSARNVIDIIFNMEQKFGIRLNEDTLSVKNNMTINGLSNAIFYNLDV